MTATPTPPPTSLHGLDADAAALQVPVTALRHYHRNPRRGDVEAIAESLQRSGQYRPIVANRGSLTGRPGEVLAGNHTLAAARSLGWDALAVTWVDVDEEGATRIVLADNRTADLGEYDTPQLAGLLADLRGDLAGTGYTPFDMDDLLAGLTADVAGAAPAPDAFPEYDDDLATDYRCPKCHYEWSGKQA